jgi:GT2 family glycosyltransferase
MGGMTTLRPDPASDPLVSVVISTWNRVDDLAVTLDGLRRQQGVSFEVIVVDNASTDGTATRLIEDYPEVRLIRMPRNDGPLPGKNLGVANARGEVVVILDSDTEPLPGALRAIYLRLADDPRLGAVNALQIDADSGRPWWWWKSIGFPEEEFLDREFDCAFVVEEGASGMRKSLYQQVGGFEERFNWFVEGRDLAAKIAHAGYAVRYCPEVRCRHHANSSRPHSNNLYRRSGRLYHEFRNEIWYTWRYFPVGWAIARSAHHLVTGARIAVREEAIGAFLRGTLDGLLGMPWVLRHRMTLDATAMAAVVTRGSRHWRRLAGAEVADGQV